MSFATVMSSTCGSMSDLLASRAFGHARDGWRAGSVSGMVPTSVTGAVLSWRWTAERSELLPGSRLELIVDAPAPGDENMRRDLALLDACARGEITGAVRLYGFDPACLSLGRMQPLDDADLEACARWRSSACCGRRSSSFR